MLQRLELDDVLFCPTVEKRQGIYDVRNFKRSKLEKTGIGVRSFRYLGSSWTRKRNAVDVQVVIEEREGEIGDANVYHPQSRQMETVLYSGSEALGQVFPP